MICFVLVQVQDCSVFLLLFLPVLAPEIFHCPRRRLRLCLVNLNISAAPRMHVQARSAGTPQTRHICVQDEAMRGADEG